MTTDNNQENGNRHNPNWFSSLTNWLFSSYPQEIIESNPSKDLLRSFHITATCRYNASTRLSRLGAFSFFTNTILALGLILIPLIQLSGFSQVFSEGMLNCVLVFLAVEALIYSIINSNSHYETRAKSLDECGNRIKELYRNLSSDIYEYEHENSAFSIHPYYEQYSRLSTVSENHGREDYWLTMLQERTYFHITGLARLSIVIKVAIGFVFQYISPTFLIASEVIVILDILKITAVFTPILNIIAK